MFLVRCYSAFLIYVLPLSVPLVVCTLWYDLVRKEHLLLFTAYYLFTALGISVGYHRLLAHQAFHTSKSLKYLLLVMGCCAWLGPPSSWVSLHLQHHGHTDKKEDPHTPRRGFWYAHCFWLLTDFKPDFNRYGRRLRKDPIVRRVDADYPWWSLGSFFLPLLLLGWVGFVWASLFRLFIVCRLTWSINSLCHWKQARDIGWLSLFTCGESFHSQHHIAPQAAYIGWHWYQIDPGKYLLWFLEKIGLIWNVQRPHKDLAQRESAT